VCRHCNRDLVCQLGLGFGAQLRFLLKDVNPSEDPAVPIEADRPSLLHDILSHHEVNAMSRHENEDATNIGDEMVHVTIMVTKVMILVIKHITSCHRGMTLRVRLPSDLILGTRANIGARLTPVPCQHLLQRVLQRQICRSTLMLPRTHCPPPLLHPHCLLLLLLLSGPLTLPTPPPGAPTHPWSPKPTNQAALELVKVKWLLEGGSVTSIYIWRIPLTFSHSIKIINTNSFSLANGHICLRAFFPL
jgi:hypothetical protein